MNILRAVKEQVRRSKFGNLLYRVRQRLRLIYHLPDTKAKIDRVVRGQRVLIVGCGPSVESLISVPPDVKILTCKRGLKILKDKGIRQIDLYISRKGTVNEEVPGEETLLDIIPQMDIDLFISDDLKWVRSISNARQVAWDRGRNNYFIERLIRPIRLEDISGAKKLRGHKTFKQRTSTGVRLLQYALYFGAKEIYLVGIDVSSGGYPWHRVAITAFGHMPVEANFIQLMSQRYTNIYSLTPDSPVTQFIPHKPLQ